MTFAERIKQARQAAGLTQQQLADQIGVGKSTVAQYEEGRRRPRLRYVERLSKALLVPAMELLQLRDERHDSD